MIRFTLSYPRNLPKLLDLRSRQVPVCTAGKTTQRQLRKTNAPERRDLTTDGSKHTAHLPIATLMDDRFNHGVPLLRVQNAQTRGSRPAVRKEDPTTQLHQSLRSNFANDLRMIDLRDLIARMEQPLCQRAIIRDEEQPLRIGIQSPHGVEPRREIRQKIKHGLTTPIIVRRRKIAARLVEKKIKPLFFCLYTLTVDGYDMMCGIIFRSECGHNRAINRNPPRLNHLLSSTARCHPRMAEDLLQSFFHVSPYRIFTALSPISCVSSRRTAAEPSIQWRVSSCRHRPSLRT